MNEKQGEHLDQRIRQSLASLPDGPPPGSSFDGARLWEQLRPELTAQPVVTKKQVYGWWLAAASVVGLLFGLWWAQPFLSSPAIRFTSKQANAVEPRERGQQNPEMQRQVQPSVPEVISTHSFTEGNNQTVRRTKSLSGVVSQHQAITNQPNRLGSPADDYSPVHTTQSAEPEPISLTIAIPVTKPTVAATPKRRFRVVHENELVAEDETYRVRYANEGNTERFVRLGTGSRTMAVPDQDSPGLTLPLNRKSTQ